MNKKSQNLHYAFYPFGDIGPIFIAVTPRGLCAVALRSPEIPLKVRRWAQSHGWDLVENRNKTALYFDSIKDYLLGKRREFHFSIDWECIESPFQKRVLKALRQVKYGEVISYSDLAARVGQPAAARAVGTAMAQNPMPLVLPCHRVIRRDGSLGGYSGGLDIKERLLSLEGIVLKE